MTSTNALKNFHFDTHISSLNTTTFKEKIGHENSREKKSKPKTTQKNSFQPHLFTSHWNGNFKYFALYFVVTKGESYRKSFPS